MTDVHWKETVQVVADFNFFYLLYFTNALKTKGDFY